MTDSDADRELEEAADRLVRGRAARPARPGTAGDPLAHQVASALVGRRLGAAAMPARLQRRLADLVARELGLGPAPDGAPPVPAGGPGRGVTRRQWLAGTGAALAAGMAGLAVGELGPHLAGAAPAPEAPDTLVPDQGSWRAVAPAAAVRVDRPVAFVAGAVTGVLVRDPTGAILALSAICTHLGCRVAWAARDQGFLCPCHGARFTATGQFAGGPWGSAYPRGLPPLPRLRSRVNAHGTVEVLTTV